MITISELIRYLTDLMEEHGDLDCCYAADDEGNNYDPVHFTPAVVFLNDENELVHPADLDPEAPLPEGVQAYCCIN